MTSADVGPRLVAGAAAGAATGTALTLAEVASSLLAGAPLPPRAWLFLAVYSIPALTVSGGGLCLLLGRRAREPGRLAALLTWLTAFVYAAAVTREDLLRRHAPAVPLRLWAITACVVCALGGARLAGSLIARHLQTRSRARLVVHAMLLIPFVAALTQSASALRAAAPPVAVLLVPLLAASAAVTAAGALGWTARRFRSRFAALSALAPIALLVAGLATHSASARAALTDGGQPDAMRHAEWLRDKPNVVLVVLDTVRASSLSSYGYSRRTTPNLDAFAARAVRFTRATTVSPWSVPSHASLLTGLFPLQHGAGRAVRGEPGPPRPEPLDGAFLTIAEALSQQGYATAGISANPLVGPAMNLAQGFRYFDARPSSRSLTLRYVPLLSRLKGVLPDASVTEPLQEWFPSAFRSATEISDAATDWLAHRRPRGQPYLLFLNYMDAHTPYVPRAGFRDRWPGRSPRLPSFGLPTAAAVMSGERPITSEEHEHLRALYDGALSYLDHEVGRLLAFLDAQPDGERTWIIVTADHGEALGEHGRLGHDCVLFQQVLHVPLIIRYPRAPGPWSKEAQPAVQTRPIQTVDVARLVLSTLGVGAALGDGPRRGEAMLAAVDCFCASEHPRFHGASGDALFTGGLKYIEEQGRPPLLFDIDGDPGERHDLAAARPADVDRLRAEMVRRREGLAALAPAGTTRSASAREREEALRALGYVR